MLASPVAGSLAEQAGPAWRRAGRRRPASMAKLAARASFEDLRWLLTRGALDGRDVRAASSRGEGGGRARAAAGARAASSRQDADAQLFRKIGIIGPLTPPDDRRGDGRRRRRARRPAQGRPGAGRRRHADRRRAAAARADPRQRPGRPAACADLARRARRPGAGRCRSRPTPCDERRQAIGRIGAYVGAPPANASRCARARSKACGRASCAPGKCRR